MTGLSDGSTRVTLATVAATAGVSVATVSKVLNGRSDVAGSTRGIVQKALQRHGYPRKAPKRPGAASHQTLEVQVDGPLRAYSCGVVQGVVDAGAQMGVAIVLSTQMAFSGKRLVERPAAWARALVDSGRVGLIAVTSELTAEHLAALQQTKLPLVVIDPMNTPSQAVTSLGSTNFAGGLAATQHLLALGHQRIAYLGGPRTAACNQARAAGYRAAMEAADATIEPGHVTTGPFDYANGAAAGAIILDLPEPPTAIFAGCDEQALGVIEAARVRGLRVPQDISVVGFDDTQLAQMASPALTTVRQPLGAIGAAALRTALRLARGETIESHHIELATTLIVRASTGSPPARSANTKN